MTPDSPLDEIQSAVYARLTGDQALMALVSGVYDEVPEDAVMPYVVIGEALETPANAHDTFGRETVLTLHAWTDTRGFSKATQITSRIVAALDHQPLAITGHHHVVTRYEFAQTLRDTQPGLRHIPIRFRIITNQGT